MLVTVDSTLQQSLADLLALDSSSVAKYDMTSVLSNVFYILSVSVSCLAAHCNPFFCFCRVFFLSSVLCGWLPSLRPCVE